MTRRSSLTPNSSVDGAKTKRIHYTLVQEACARAGLVQRAASFLGVLGRTSETILQALLKTLRLFKRFKLGILIKFSDLSQAVSLHNPFTCVKKSCGSVMEQLKNPIEPFQRFLWRKKFITWESRLKASCLSFQAVLELLDRSSASAWVGARWRTHKLCKAPR